MESVKGYELMKTLGNYITESKQLNNIAATGDGFDIEINDALCLETTIIDVFEDGILVNSDSTGYQLLKENGCTFEDGPVVSEGYQVLPPMDPKYVARRGLEGPYPTLSGKVVYYDPREGSYYDPDSDIYLTYDEYRSYDTDSTVQEPATEAMGVDQDEARLKVDSTLDAQQGAVDEAEYQGHEVTLNKPTAGDVKKSKVYVKDPKTGNIKKVNFGDPDMTIKKYIPARKKSFRARHNCDNPGPKTKARYWSCKAW